jgi:hypothetical protein
MKLDTIISLAVVDMSQILALPKKSHATLVRTNRPIVRGRERYKVTSDLFLQKATLPKAPASGYSNN